MFYLWNWIDTERCQTWPSYLSKRNILALHGLVSALSLMWEKRYQLLSKSILLKLLRMLIELFMTYNEECQVTKPTSPLQSCRSRTDFWHSRSRSIAVAPNWMCRAFFLRDYFLHPRTTALERERECQNLVRERQLCSGDVGSVTRRSSSNIPAKILN